MNPIEIKLCDIQGRLFELSLEKGFDSESFVKHFMASKVAEDLDSTYNRMQWAGEEYIMEELIDECGDVLQMSGKLATKDEIYWIGYIYRYWHYYKDEKSKKIYKQAPYERMKINYLMFHTMAPEMAIDDLIEIYKQNKK
jgi:hypothetical protein